MLVFHTLFAGNIGQLAAPGTVVAGDASIASGLGALFIVMDIAVPVALVTEGAAATAWVSAAGRVGPAATGLAAQPAALAVAQARAAAATAARKVNVLDAKCPVRMLTVESWHGRYPAYPATAKFVTVRADTRRAAVAVLYSATHGGTPLA
jgi:hypothetical protein